VSKTEKVEIDAESCMNFVMENDPKAERLVKLFREFKIMARSRAEH
jgi:hypothetical protein